MAGLYRRPGSEITENWPERNRRLRTKTGVVRLTFVGVLVLAQLGLFRTAVRHHVEPVTVPPVLGHSMFVGREDDCAIARAQALHLNQAQFPGLSVQTGEVVTEVLLVNVGHSANTSPAR